MNGFSLNPVNKIFQGKKFKKTIFWKFENPVRALSDTPISLVRELIEIDATLHLHAKFHRNRTIFTRVIELTDTYIDIYIDIYIYIYIYTKLNEWCFWHLGTSKQKNNTVPGLGLTVPPTVIASSLWGKFANKATWSRV